MKDRLRYALIGSGGMGRGHIGALEGIEEIEIVAIADPFAESRAKALEALGRQVPTYADYRRMLDAEKPDAVVIATPNYTHADIVCDALEAGCHVLGEKPMASTIEGCNRIVGASRCSGRVYQVGLELRYAALWQRLHSLIREGRIGRVRQLWCKEFRGPWALKVEQWITQREKSGGTLAEKNCHHFDLFNWYVGQRALRVAGFGSVDLVYGRERFGITPTVLDNAQVVVQYEGGAVAALMVNMYCTAYGEGLELGVIGTEGWIIANSGASDSLRVSPRGGGETTTIAFGLPPEIVKISHKGAVYFEHLAFLDNMRSGSRPLTDATVGWWSTAIGLAAERAVEETRVVSLSEMGAGPEP